MSFSFCFPQRGGLRFLHWPPLFWQLWHSLQAMPSPFWLCDTRCRQCSSPFWLCGIRYRRGPSGVRDMHSVLKKASWCTRRVFIKGTRCKKQAFPVQKRYSVPETPFCGTEQDSLNRKRVSLALLRNRDYRAAKFFSLALADSA